MPVYLAEPLPVERGAPEAPAQVLKGCNGLRRKGKKKKMRKEKKQGRMTPSVFHERWMLFQRLHLVNYSE